MSVDKEQLLRGIFLGKVDNYKSTTTIGPASNYTVYLNKSQIKWIFDKLTGDCGFLGALRTLYMYKEALINRGMC